MNILNPYEKYKQQSVLAASRGELIVMLFDGCLRFLRNAKTHIENKNIQESHNNLIKASNIILELMGTLDMSFEISQQIMELYVYIYHEIKQANIKKDSERLGPVIDLVAEFRDTWREASKNDRSRRYGS